MKIFAFTFFVFTLFFNQQNVFAKKKNSVNFVSIKNGQEFKSPFTVKMNVKGMALHPAGEELTNKKAGHHHIIINGQPIPEGIPIPNNEKNLHYGKAQTEATITLPIGEHTLTLQFGDGSHISYGPELSQTVKIKVIP